MSNTLSRYRAETGKTLEDIGDALGVNKSTVLRWEQDRIPAERVIDVERATGIPRAKLRPDLFGDKT